VETFDPDRLQASADSVRTDEGEHIEDPTATGFCHTDGSAMRLYKFLDKHRALTSIRERRLKIARLTGLNDPFEILPFDFSDRVSNLAWR
jgi:hypothetical protein